MGPGVGWGGGDRGEVRGVRPGRGLRSAGERTCRKPRGRRPARSRVAGSRPGSPQLSSRSPFRDGGTLRRDLPSVSLPRASTPSLVQLFRTDPSLFQLSSGVWSLGARGWGGESFQFGRLGAQRVGWIGQGRGGRLEVKTTSLVFRSEVLVGNGLKDMRGRQLQSRSEYAFLSNSKKEGVGCKNKRVVQ